MLRRVVGSSLKFRRAVIAFAATVMLFGITQLRDMPADVLPEFTPPYVEIQTEALGLSAAEVEQLITVPMEADLLNGVAWLDQIRSESVPGLSSIELIFEPGTDLLRARQVVQERLTQAHALPNVSKPPVMLQPLSSSSRAMMVGLSSDDLSLIELSVLARWKIKPRLMGVPGVANVAVWGQRERQLQVQVDPQRLRDNGVSLVQVMKTTGNALWVSPLSFVEASTPGTGGFIDTPNQRLGVQHVSPIKTADDLALVTVEDTQGKVLRLGDVAKVVEDHQPLIGDAVVNDGPSLMLVIEKFPEANTVDVTRSVEAALQSLRPGLPGVEMDTNIYRPATFIQTTIDNLTAALVLGSLLLVLVIGLLFFNWRVALISLLTIPLALLAAGSVLYLRGATVNAMVLAGLVLALGIVVDDAVVDIDRVRRRLHQRADDGTTSTPAVVREAVLEVRGPLIYATVIIATAALPFIFLKGLSGVFFRPLVLSFLLAVLASMLVALTVTPALSAVLLRKSSLSHRGESPLVRALQRGHQAVLSRIVHRSRWAYGAVAAAAVLTLAGLAALPQLGPSLLPSVKETNLLISWDGAPGTSHAEMSRITAQASRELRSIPGVRDVGAHVGRAITSDRVVSVNSSELWVSLDPEVDYDKTVAAVKDVVDGYPGLAHNVQTYLKERVRQVLTGADDPITVRVFGQDTKVLAEQAQKVRKVLASVDGVVDERVAVRAEEPTVQIEVDLAAAQRHGIKPGDVRRAAATLLSGVEVGSLFEEQKVFEVVVWGAPQIRHSVPSIRELLIDTPSGGHVRLGEVADVRISAQPNVIERDAVSRYVDIGANVSGRDLGAVVSDVERGLKSIDFPIEYHAELLGEYAEQQAARNQSLIIGAAAAIGVFLLLQACFGSWRLAILACLTLPLALAGGVLAAFLGGGVVSLGSAVGFLAVFGIAVRHVILLISSYRRLEREEGQPAGPALVLRGTRERLGPIILTSLATGLALVPLVVLGDGPGREIVNPMAVVVLGGLLSAILTALFIVPALYLRFATGSTPDSSGSQAAEPELSLSLSSADRDA